MPRECPACLMPKNECICEDEQEENDPRSIRFLAPGDSDA